MQVYTDELCHFGIPGMKWGRRKGPSTKEMRNDRNNIIKSELTKAYKKHDVYNKNNDYAVEIAASKANMEAYKKQLIKC